MVLSCLREVDRETEVFFTAQYLVKIPEGLNVGRKQ
jgi:hypothetical protein